MDVSLLNTDKTHWSFKGTLDFFTVPEAWLLLKKVLLTEKSIKLSFADVSSANSAALGLIVEAKKTAKQQGCDLEIKGVSNKLKALAKMSNLEIFS